VVIGGGEWAGGLSGGGRGTEEVNNSVLIAFGFEYLVSH